MNLSLLVLFATTACIQIVRCDDCSSPLFKAIKRNDENLVRQLLANGADTSQTCGYFKETPLIMAVDKGNLKLVKILLPKSNAKTADRKGTTALMYAAFNDNLDMVKILLPKSDAKAATRIGFTALMYAAYRDNLDMVKILLPKSDVKATNERGQSALDYATDNEVIRLIQQYI